MDKLVYFKKNKSLYYDNLTFVTTKNDMKQWLKYFLVGIIKTEENSSQTLSNILEMKDRLEKKINAEFGKKKSNRNDFTTILIKETNGKC